MKNLRGILILCAASLSVAAMDPRLEQGARFESLGEYEKALGEYRAVLASEPRNAKAFFAAGAVRYKMKDYAGAVANYKLAYKFAPSMTEAYEGAAKAYEKQGDRASAAAERKKMPQMPEFDDGKADASAEKIEAPVEKKTKSEPAASSKFDYSSAKFDMMKRAFDSKSYKAACDAAREVLAKDPGNPGAFYYAGAGRYERGEFDKAEYNLRKAFDYPDLGYNAHYYLSLIYRKQGRTLQEKAELEEYVKYSKNESAVSGARARIAELSGRKSPEQEASKIPSADPANSSSTVSPQPEKPVPVAAFADSVKPASKKKADDRDKAPDPVSVELANQAYKLGNYASALSLYHDLLSSVRDENSRSYILLQMGNVFRNRRDFRSAVAKYREAVELYPNSGWASEAQRAWEDAVWQEKNASLLPRR